MRSNVASFVVIWMALAIGGFFGLPIEWLPGPLPEVLLICGSFLALVSFGLARSGRALQMPPLSRIFVGLRPQPREVAGTRSRFHGWPVLLLQWMRATALLAFLSVVMISLVRPHVHIFHMALPWIFVSVTGAVGSILGRSWLRSVGALQCLPIRKSALALVVCLALVAPVALSSLAATAVSAIVPAWGLTIPLYMVPGFAIVPALEMSWHHVQTSHPIASSVQEWSPMMQVIAWPVWTGSFMSLELTRLLPGWFDAVAIAAAAVLAVIGYTVVLRRIRSGIGLERIGDALTPR